MNKLKYLLSPIKVRNTEFKNRAVMAAMGTNMANDDGTASDAFAANIFRYEGDVKVKRARQFVWKGVSGNTALSVGDQIKTASHGSAQILYFDGNITTVKPGSLVEIRELFEDPKTKVRKIREKVNWGGVTATTAGANVAGSFHEVATETATARAVQKAEFEVD